MLVVGAIALAGGATIGIVHLRDEELEEDEERERARDHLWRVAIAIEGAGRVKSVVPAFDCASDGGGVQGECGPKLVRFAELAPPLLEAIAAPGSRFVRWESRIREPDGAVAPRRGPMPDGRFYLNGFGFDDTGELETVTAVFTPDADASR